MSDDDALSVRLETELHYVEEGTGPLVVLVHGGFGDYRLWGNLTSVLSQRFRVISYSRRGAFPNTPPKEGSAISTHSEDLSSLISRLSNVPVYLVGESIGAYVALHCAVHYPGKVRALAVDEPPILSLLSGNEGDRADADDFRSKALTYPLTLFSAGESEGAVRVMIDYLEGSAGVYDSLPEVAKGSILANCRATLLDLDKGLTGIEPSDLESLNVPTLLMKSTIGPKLLKRVVDRLNELIPTSQLREINGTSHGTIVESPEYARTVLEFLKEH